jgi:gluconokinase
MNSFPKSAYETAGGMAYFPRMLDKLRLHAEGKLREEYHANLGTGMDGRCCHFLRVDYAALRARVLAGGEDKEILGWCFAQGRALDGVDVQIWNGFVTKFGWRDKASAHLEKVKREGGLEGREDIVTMVDYFEVDEGRKG